MKKTAVLFLALLVLFMFCACRKNELCGKWYSQQEGNTVIFDKNGDFCLHFWDGDIIKGTYVIEKQEGNHLTLTLCDSKGRRQDTTVTIKGDNMSMTNGIYEKQ